MEITSHALWTMIHGMLFGALYLLACSGALVGLYRFNAQAGMAEPTLGEERFLRLYLITMIVLAWAAVLTGTYVVYPWYRAVPPPGAVDLSLFPQRLLMSSPTTIEWHSLGMEWKEHVGWFAAIGITMVGSSSSDMAAILGITGNFGRQCWFLRWLHFLLLELQVSSAQ